MLRLTLIVNGLRHTPPGIGNFFIPNNMAKWYGECFYVEGMTESLPAMTGRLLVFQNGHSRDCSTLKPVGTSMSATRPELSMGI